MSETCFNSSCSNHFSGSFGQLLTSSIQFLLTADCMLKENWPEDSTSRISEWRFDYIVIGAGSAGAVVAARLSEDSCRRVLLVEAGGDPPIDSIVPDEWSALFLSDYDWQYRTENDSRTCQGYQDGRCYWPRGKMLGGSSSMNSMLYCRAHFKNYDDMEKAGNHGWNSREALKYFKKSEHLFSKVLENDPIYGKYHNTHGLLGISPFNGTNPYIIPIIESYKSIGYNLKRDIGDMINIGVARVLGFIEDGKRESTARAFLIPARNRSNLFILKNAIVTKILFEGKTAIGVQIELPSGIVRTAAATKEVIVSGGTVNTPQLLMLSGIGPKERLAEHKITVVKDLAVGENLHDHHAIYIFFRANEGAAPETVNEQTLDLATYLAYRRGPLAQVEASEINIYINIYNDNAKQFTPPNIQIDHITFRVKSETLDVYCNVVLLFNAKICESLLSYNADAEIIMFLVAVIDPKSRGFILLNSTNYRDSPKIFTNAFTNAYDIKTLVKGAHVVEKLENTPSMKNLGGELLKLNIPECDRFRYRSDKYWECYILQTASTGFHPMGSCKMGPKHDLKAVVDPELRVHGIENLRVVDASIFPSSITCNTNAPTIMVAERASDLIKKTYKDDSCGP